ncbi:type I polyketide synthase, partial [Streptomyces sp. NPDC055287]
MSDNSLFRVQWVPFDVPADSASTLTAETVVLGDGSGAAADAAPGATNHPDLESLGAVITEGGPVPPLVIAPLFLGPDDEAATPEQVHAAVHHALALLRTWVSDDRFAASRLVLVTRQAVATHRREVPHLAQAAVRGLVRAAQAEYPDRFTLVDLDEGAAETGGATILAAVAAQEPEAAVRRGVPCVPRLGVATDRHAPQKAFGFTPGGTVLVTGGTGALGALTARHLVTHHGVTRLLLTSRRGPEAEGAEQLRTELTALGAHITLTACDAADHNALTHLINTIPTEHPLTAVIHTAGTVDMGLLPGLTFEQVESVMRPKVDAAWNLHRLTEGMDLDAFVLFSSIAGTLGAPGQANYAAANTFLDALAHHRHAQNLPATSLAWGPWAHEAGMIRHLSDSAVTHIGRSGFPPLPTGEALALFDATLASPAPSLVTARLDASALRLQAHQGVLPRLLRGLVKPEAPADVPAGDDSGTHSFNTRLAALPEADRPQYLVELVRDSAAAVLAHSDPEALDLEQTFKGLGFDSLTTVQFRNHLNAATDLGLPTTLAFDHPTPAALAQHLYQQLTESAPTVAPTPPASATGTREEPIAIVGIGCRYPGGVASAEDLWELVSEGRDAISGFPSNRGWDTEA